MSDKLLVKKVSDFDTATTIEGGFVNGIDENGKSVKFPIRLLKGNKGDIGDTPYIGSNGNWWIDGEDTGHSASGVSLEILNEYLKISDLAGSKQAQIYTSIMSGASISGKSNSLLINADALVTIEGFLSKVTMNASENGTMTVHILNKNGSVFSSVENQIINIEAGTSEYDVSLGAKVGQYVGLEVSPTNASVYVAKSSIGFYGGANNTALSFVKSDNICYGFKISNQLKELEDFEKNILDTAQSNTEKYINDEIDLNDVLQKSDLVEGGVNYVYHPDLNGTADGGGSSSMLINALAETSIKGWLKEITINSAESGKLKVHVFERRGNVFQSISNQEIDVLAGIHEYDVLLQVLSENNYIGLEVSTTYAKIKTFNQSANKEGFYGGANNTNLSFIKGSLICYGFKIYKEENASRPKEVVEFREDIIEETNTFVSQTVAKKTASAGHLLYRYDMKEDSTDFSNSGWTFGSGGASPSIQGYSGKLFVKKQINIETKIQRCVATLQSDTNLVLFTEGKEENTMKTAVSIDATNNSIAIYDIFASTSLPSIRATKVISFPLVANRKYVIEMYRLARANGIRIMDPITGKSDSLEVYPTQLKHGTDKEVYTGGLQYDQFGIFWNGGTAPIIYEISCGYYGAKNPLLYIVGDSITYGYGTNDMAATFAHSIGALTGGDYVVSPRGGGKMAGVIEKIQTECAIIKPKYVMVTVGANQTASMSQLNQLIDAIKNIGSIPIINCIPCVNAGDQTTGNNNILSTGVYTCRFDLATCIDPTASILKADLSFYVDGGVHPNIEGFKRMTDRVRIDLPFLI